MAADVNQPVDKSAESTTNSTAETSRNLYADVDFGKMPQKDSNKDKPESPQAAATTSDAQATEKAVADPTKVEGGDGTVSAAKANQIAQKEQTEGVKTGTRADVLANGHNASYFTKDDNSVLKVSNDRVPGATESGTRQNHLENGANPNYFQKDDNSNLKVSNDRNSAAPKDRVPSATETGTRQNNLENGSNPFFHGKDDNSNLPVSTDRNSAAPKDRVPGATESGTRQNHLHDARNPHFDSRDDNSNLPASERSNVSGKQAVADGTRGIGAETTRGIGAEGARGIGKDNVTDGESKVSTANDAAPDKKASDVAPKQPMVIDEKTGEVSFPEIKGYDKSNKGEQPESNGTPPESKGEQPGSKGEQPPESKGEDPGSKGAPPESNAEQPGSKDKQSSEQPDSKDKQPEPRVEQTEANLEQGTNGGDGQAQLDAALQRMRDGGWLKDAKGGDGNLTTEELRAGKFETNADKFTDATSKKEFGNQVRSVLQREDIPASEKAEILNRGQNMIEMNEKSDFGERGMKSQENRELLTTTMFENLGKNWNSNSQGDNGTCALTEVAAAQAYLNPAQVARDTENIVKDGVWDTNSNKHIHIHDSFMKPDAEASKGLDKDANGNDLGNRNFHTQLMNGKDGSWLNQQQGKLYTNGTAADGYTEAIWKPGKDANGKDTWVLDSKGSPDVQPSEAADMAKDADYGMGKNVTVAVDKSGWSTADSKNLTDSRNLNNVVKDIEAGKLGDKHYMIMLGAGGDKLLQNGRDVDAGQHSGHAYGAAFSKTANINDRVAGEKQGGEWKAKNTWTDATTATMDRALVGADGKMNVAAAQRSMDMSIDRSGQPTGGQGSYREWSENHPGGNGMDPKPEELKKLEKKDEQKPIEEGDNDKNRKAQLDRSEGVRALSEFQNLRAQQDAARQRAASATGSEALTYISAAAALDGRVADLLPRLQIA